MYIKIHTGKEANNRGSCKDLVNYLEKENQERDVLDQEYFFDQTHEDVASETVQSSIDSNVSKLGREEAKFYMISINPSSEEQKHILKQITGRDVQNVSRLTAYEKKEFEKALKDYSRKVMDNYAKNFNRGLTGNDILYYGKVEHCRYYSKDSQEVKDKLKKIGEVKEGMQTHVHIVVSRKDITGKIRLSPNANAKNAKNNLKGKKVQIGFDRNNFVRLGEATFDSHFRYNRPQHLSYDHRHTMKNGMRGVAISALRDVPLVSEYSKISRIFNTKDALVNAKDPLQVLTTAVRQVPGGTQCIRALSYVNNPAKLVLDIGKKILKTGLSHKL